MNQEAFRLSAALVGIFLLVLLVARFKWHPFLALMFISWGLAVTFDTLRIRSITSACCSKFPCEKFSRATFMPVRIRRSRISGEFDAGPIVATIFVYARVISLLLGPAATPAISLNNRH